MGSFIKNGKYTVQCMDAPAAPLVYRTDGHTSTSRTQHSYVKWGGSAAVTVTLQGYGACVLELSVITCVLLGKS